ncbi:small ribosomal subunit protein eS26x-like [Aegilops tauschii subsp. strangulata]|uniref:small ribosomal subunit protein eS26x-like n=1 Tax=Aegilops tauschii subsp. strangulata TaxID=200361 RepID=UPI003CC8DFCD
MPPSCVVVALSAEETETRCVESWLDRNPYKDPETSELGDAAADHAPYISRLRPSVAAAAMTFKRRNGGRNKHGRGHVRFVRCVNCGKCVPKDKVIKRYTWRNIVAKENIRDFTEACALEGYHLPKIYIKERWCIGCIIHKKEIGVRSRKDRKNRAPPERFRRRELPRPEGQAPRPGGDGRGPGGVGGGPGGADGGFGAGGPGGGAGGGFGAGAPAPNVAGGWPQN